MPPLGKKMGKGDVFVHHVMSQESESTCDSYFEYLIYRCALKFFGYTNHKPVLKDIHQEIRLMISLDKVDGVCQLLGVFDDTPTGLMPEKYAAFSESYPVIVMEMLEGGDLFARISARNTVTENYLAVTFMSMVRALQSLHARNFLHRDLKLGNVLLFLRKHPFINPFTCKSSIVMIFV